MHILCYPTEMLLSSGSRVWFRALHQGTKTALVYDPHEGSRRLHCTAARNELRSQQEAALTATLMGGLPNHKTAAQSDVLLATWRRFYGESPLR